MLRSETLTRKLLTFYSPELFRLLRDVVARRTGLSLRLIDWFVTSYARRNASSFLLDGARVIVFHEYKAMLKSYSKTSFDPFCRRARIFVDCESALVVHGPAGGAVLETTNGQLNFFRWAIGRGILVHASSLLPDIEADLSAHTQAVKAGKAWHEPERHACYRIGTATVLFD
jgi:hypothetical protein